MKPCTTHHNACDCREALFSESIRLLQLMYEWSDKPASDDNYRALIADVGYFLRKMEVKQ